MGILKNTKISDVVVTEPELSAALSYLKSLPHSVSAAMPEQWSRKRLIQLIDEALGDCPDVGSTYMVAPGVYALLQYFGTDIMGGAPNETKLQVWLLLRPESDPNKLAVVR